MHRDAESIALRRAAESQVGGFRDDPLVAFQAREAFRQVAARHQRIADDVESRAPDPGDVQGDRRVAAERHRTLPQTAHRILREARVGVLQGLVVEAQLGEQLASVEAFQLQGEDDALNPAGQGCTFRHRSLLVLAGGTPTVVRLAAQGY